MRIVNCTLKSFLSSFNTVILFGTGKMALEAAGEEGLLGKIEYCVDNDERMLSGHLNINGTNLPIHAPDKLCREDWTDKVLLIASSHYEAIAEQLKLLLPSASVKVFIYPVIRLNYEGREDFFTSRILRDCINEYREGLSRRGISSGELERLLDEKREFIMGEGSRTRPFVIPRTMVMPTTRCNMRCVGCSSLLPLFEKPQDVPAAQILKDLRIFFSAIDECVRLTIGGEPFLYPDLAALLEYLIHEPKLLNILLITNSTILPDDAVTELLKNEKVYVEVSDYGQLEKMSRIVTLFERNNVKFEVLTDQIWDDLGGTEKRGRSLESLRRIYLGCEQGRLMKGVHDGRFHTCARSARMYALGAYSSEKDYFSLDEQGSPDLIRQRLKDMYYSEQADACDHCDLGASPNRKIPAGIQAGGGMKKSEYTIVRRNELEGLKLAAKRCIDDK